MKFFRVILAVLIMFSISHTFLFGVGVKTSAQSVKPKPEYKGIISMWHIDTFEGGTGSRKQFLSSIASEYEKKNKGVLINVAEYTETAVEENLKKGILPDIISYGNGINLTSLSAINTNKIFKGGLIGDKAYATPWCRGGYVIIANPKFASEIHTNLDELVVSKSKYNQPIIALIESGIKTDNISVKSPMDAYMQFVNGNTKYMLGTQRDIIRLKNRSFNVHYKVLEGFNDLYQYVSITTTDNVKRFYAESFVEYLLSQGVQERLSKIAMLSEFYNSNNNEQALIDMQNIKTQLTISAFIEKQVISDLDNISLLAYGGNQEQLSKIKNILI